MSKRVDFAEIFSGIGGKGVTFQAPYGQQIIVPREFVPKLRHTGRAHRFCIEECISLAWHAGFQFGREFARRDMEKAVREHMFEKACGV